MEFNLNRVKPYGDTKDDGMVQMSFTLPVPSGDKAREAARIIASKMGLNEPEVVYMTSLDKGFTYFIVYGECQYEVDYEAIEVTELDKKILTKEEINEIIITHLGRKIKVLGACIDSDAHTVGIDAIMNMKGYDGDKGLESYSWFDAINMGAQVPSEELVAEAIDREADVLLISQVVTQKNSHIKNLTRLVEMLEAEGLRENVIAVIGGPRINQEIAKELGYDAGFGPGTYAQEVASFLALEIKKRYPKKDIAHWRQDQAGGGE